MDRKVLFIGGSPCSGKSTVAEILAAETGGYHFKVDDCLFECMKRGAQDGKEACLWVAGATPDAIRMRDPAVQCDEEFRIYREIAPYVFEKLSERNEPLIIAARPASLVW